MAYTKRNKNRSKKRYKYKSKTRKRFFGGDDITENDIMEILVRRSAMQYNLADGTLLSGAKTPKFIHEMKFVQKWFKDNKLFMEKKDIYEIIAKYTAIGKDPEKQLDEIFSILKEYNSEVINYTKYRDLLDEITRIDQAYSVSSVKVPESIKSEPNRKTIIDKFDELVEEIEDTKTLFHDLYKLFSKAKSNMNNSFHHIDDKLATLLYNFNRDRGIFIDPETKKQRNIEPSHIEKYEFKTKHKSTS